MPMPTKIVLSRIPPTEVVFGKALLFSKDDVRHIERYDFDNLRLVPIQMEYEIQGIKENHPSLATYKVEVYYAEET